MPNPLLLTLPAKHATTATPPKPKGRRCPYLFNATCDDGAEVVVHTPGLMLGGYVASGRRLLVKPEQGRARHSNHSLVAILDDSRWVGGNPSLGNQVACAAIKAGLLEEFNSNSEIFEEQKIGDCRYDLCIDDWVIEVKSSSFAESGCGLFPVQLLTDLVKRKPYREPTSSRFIAQINAMNAMQDRRTCIMMVVQRTDCTRFAINPLDSVTAEAVAQSNSTKIAFSVEWNESGECVFGQRLDWY